MSRPTPAPAAGSPPSPVQALRRGALTASRLFGGKAPHAGAVDRGHQRSTQEACFEYAVLIVERRPFHRVTLPDGSQSEVGPHLGMTVIRAWFDDHVTTEIDPDAEAARQWARHAGYDAWRQQARVIRGGGTVHGQRYATGDVEFVHLPDGTIRTAATGQSEALLRQCYEAAAAPEPDRTIAFREWFRTADVRVDRMLGWRAHLRLDGGAEAVPLPAAEDSSGPAQMARQALCQLAQEGWAVVPDADNGDHHLAAGDGADPSEPPALHYVLKREVALSSRN